MCGEQGFIAVHETVHLVKFKGKCRQMLLNFFFRVLMLRYLVLQDILSNKVFVPDSYNFRFVLVLVCFSP